MSLGLTESSTSEEISAYAEQIATEVAEERAGEQKPDAQIISEQAGKENIPAVTKSGKTSAVDDSDDSTLDDQGDDSEETPTSPKWLTDDVKAEAKAYGISESEISDFSSREELDRALRLFDKSALEAGRKALANGDDDPTRNEKGQFEKKTSKVESKAETKNPVESLYKVELDPDLYDEAIISEFTKINDLLESRLSQLESRFTDVRAQSEEQKFDSIVDALDFSDLFGKTGHESESELQRRRDLHVAMKAQMIGLERLGRPTDLSQNLVARVARMVFADEIGKRELKQRTKKVSKMSNLRQGGGAARPQSPSENPRDEFDRLYRELDRS